MQRRASLRRSLPSCSLARRRQSRQTSTPSGHWPSRYSRARLPPPTLLRGGDGTDRFSLLEIEEAQCTAAPEEARGAIPGVPPALMSVLRAAVEGGARVDFFVAQGDRLMASRRYDVVVAYRSAASKSPAASIARNRLGDAYAVMGRWRDAQVAYERALALDPRDLDARHGLARVMMTRRNAEGAAVQLEQVLQVSELTSALRISSLTQLGAAYIRLGRPSDAIRVWETVVGEGSPGAPVHYSLGVAYATIGDTDRAGRHWEAAMAVDPEHMESRIALAQASSPYGPDFVRAQQIQESPDRSHGHTWGDPWPTRDHC